MIKKTKIFSVTKIIKMKKSIALFAVNIGNLKTLKHNTFLKKLYSFLVFAVSVRIKIFKEKNQLRYQKFMV